jgi:formylglycine-generating enzyme required for sulfatase activity
MEVRLYKYRAIVHARLGRAKEAKDDLTKFQQFSLVTSEKLYVDSLVAVYLGEDLEGMERVQTALRTHGRQSVMLYNAACAHSVASGLCAAKDVQKADLYADQALALLKEAIAGGYSNYSQLQTDTDLDPLRRRADFLLLFQGGQLEQNYAAIWQPVAGLNSIEIRGHDPGEHLTRCQELIARHYRPVSLSVAQIRANQPLVQASIWHRPGLPDEDKECLAKRQANAAVALLKLDRPESVWRLFRHQQDPTVRSYLIHRLARLGVEPAVAETQLDKEQDNTIRRALILGLGEYGEEAWPTGTRGLCLKKIQELYRSAHDPGLHAAAEWLLRRWKQEEWLRRTDEAWAKDKQQTEKRLECIKAALEHEKEKAKPKWYVNGEGQTFAVLPMADFLMGSPRMENGRTGGAENRLEDLHKKRIGRTFAIATHEVTVEQFLRLRAGYQYSGKHSPTRDCPINGVGWYDAAEYCNLLSQREGLPREQWCYLPNPSGKYAAGMKMAPDYLQRTGYRLPTEAEWEYACRAGSLTSRYYGQAEELLEKYAWYSKNSLSRRLAPVGLLKPNDWGMFDMMGNAAEWTQDRWSYYLDSEGRPLDDPTNLVIDAYSRAVRGGGFNHVPDQMRSANRFAVVPTNRSNNVGFRPARTFP